MTVIASDGKTMAADGLEAEDSGYIVNKDAVKILRMPDGSIVGGAGDAYATAAVFQWFTEGELDDNRPELGMDKDSPFEMLVLREDGNLFTMDNRFTLIEARRPYAIGVGDQMARAAMLLGLEPYRCGEVRL